VLGDPIEHSLSPVLHRAALASSGLLGSYERRRVSVAGMKDAVVEIREGILQGANVTMPHKQLAAALSDRVSTLAARAGAVNTLVSVNGDVVGHNTDVAGIRNAWRAKGLPEDAAVLILGTGGAAAAALLALEGRRLMVSGRRPKAADALIAQVGVAATTVEWGTRRDGVVLVNATPLGMSGESLPHGLVDSAAGLFDMAYGASRTAAVTAAGSRSLPSVNGVEMLLHQAAVAFELWTGMTAPLAAMGAALRNELAAGMPKMPDT